MQAFSSSPRKQNLAFLLPAGLLMLSMAVFAWGLQYKLSLYKSKDSISHSAPEAKLLSQKERPVVEQLPAFRPTQLPVVPVLPALLMLVTAPGLYLAAIRNVRIS